MVIMSILPLKHKGHRLVHLPLLSFLTTRDRTPKTTELYQPAHQHLHDTDYQDADRYHIARYIC